MRRLFFISVGILIILAGWGFLVFGTGKGYQTYLSNAEFRRMHPELLPSEKLVRFFDLGHTTTYASFKWLELIQFIGENTANNQFLGFSHTLIEHITHLHPFFSKPYELDLLFAPIRQSISISKEEKEKREAYAAGAIELGKRGIERLCDPDKVARIHSTPITDELWERDDIKNPCADGMLPYYLAFAIQQSGKNKTEASDYYKLASLNDDAPKASRTLSILAKAAEGDHFASALNFFLLAATGYDKDPYTCQQLANNLIPLATEKSLHRTQVASIIRYTDALEDTREKENPNSLASNNCYDMTLRGTRELLLAYITESASGSTAKTGDELIEVGKLSDIPHLKDQPNMTVILENGIWQYREKVK